MGQQLANIDPNWFIHHLAVGKHLVAGVGSLLLSQDPFKTGRIRRFFHAVDIRRLYILIGIIMHTAVAITMNLGPFSAITMSYYVCCIHHDEWVKLWNGAKSRLFNHSASILKTEPDAKSAT